MIISRIAFLKDYHTLKFLLILWEFDTTCFGHIHPLSQLFPGPAFLPIQPLFPTHPHLCLYKT